MKKFILVTISESADYYTYFVESANKPSMEKVMEFLKENAHDRDEEYVYETLLILTEFTEFKTIK